MRDYLASVIKTDQCAQYVDDIGIAANTPEQLIKNIRAVFKCTKTACLTLTIEKCHFGVTQVEFLGKKFLAIYRAFLEYSHILWETTTPTLVLTENRSITRFFQTKTTPPALGKACNYVLQFKFRVMHVAGSQNTAADFLSRLELTPKEKVQLKLRGDILTSPIEVNLHTSE